MQATKGKQKLAFFTMPEYEAWKETAAPGWTVKYYKGLGTSDKKEAQEYFADIDLHRKTFVHEGVHSFSYLRCSESDFSLDRPLNQRPEPSNAARGLETSDVKEAQEYCADIDLHRKTFVHEG